MSLEEVKNRQNAAKNCSQAAAPNKPNISDIGSSEHDILSIESTRDIMGEDSSSHADREVVPASKNGFCSPVASDRLVGPHRRLSAHREVSLPSPVSNLMEEFDKLTCQDQKTAVGSLAGKSNHTATKPTCQNSQPESTRQLRKRKDLTSLQGPKPGAAPGKAEDTNSRTEVGTQLEAAENGVWGEDAPQLCTSKLQPETSSQCALNAPSSKEKQRWLFLLGEQPSKLDNDVLTALSGMEVDSQKYPAVFKWNMSVQSYSSFEQQSWSSPSLRGKPTSQLASSPSSSPAYYSPGKNSPGFGSPGKLNAFAAGFSPDFRSPGRSGPAYMNHVLLSKRHHLSGPLSPIH